MNKYNEGQVIVKFTSKKGKEIELRIPKKGDEKNYLDFINSIIAENRYILLDKPVNDLKEEKKWLENMVKNTLNNKMVSLTAFYKNKIIGNTDVTFAQYRQKHLGSFGIVIKDKFRQEGIGTKMMEVIFNKAKKHSIKIVFLEVFANNIRAIKAYEKMGFIQHGLLPKAISWRRKYIDAIMMYKNLD